MPEKKKVLFVITKGNFGGAQRYVYDLATNLPKDQYEVVVACGDGGLLIERLKDLNIRTIEIEGLGREIEVSKDFKVFKNLIKIIKEERPDVIHLNSSKIGGVGAVAARTVSLLEKNYRPKIIFTAHNWGFNDRSRSLTSRIFYYIAHYWTVVLCNHVIAVSEKTKRDVNGILGWPFLKNRVAVIYNGISNFKPLSRKEARRLLAGNETKKTIIFSLAELHKNKGIDVALKALSLLPKETREKIIYCVAGSGEEKENLEKMVSELDMEEMVRFLGFVPDAKKLLSGSDIFLLPSRTEAFPYALLEAGIVGLPIVATRVGGIPEVIHDMQNGILIHPKNPKEAAEATLYLLDHPSKKRGFGGEIKKTVSNFFSLEKMLEETIKLYQ